MIVREIFKMANKEDVFLSYIRRYDIIEPWDHRGQVKDEVKYYHIFKERLFNFIDKMANASCDFTDEAADNNSIVFVVDINACEFDDVNKKAFEVFSVKKKEFLEKAKKSFKIWESPGPETISHYSFSFCEVEKVAAYEVASQSIEEYGIEAVVAAICYEMQIFSFGEDEKEKQEFIDSLTSITERIENGEEKYYSADEVFDKLRENFYAKVNDEEKLEYFRKKDDFEDSVADYVNKWHYEKTQENHQILIDFLRKEYSTYIR